MSDYLSNLAARTLKLTDVIQPRLASRFEPVQTQGRLGFAQSTDPLTTEAELALNAEQTVDPASVSTAQAFTPGSPVGKAALTPVPRSAKLGPSADPLSPAPPAQRATEEEILPRPAEAGAIDPTNLFVSANDHAPSAPKHPYAIDDAEEPARYRPQISRLDDLEKPAERGAAQHLPIERQVQDDHGQAQVERQQTLAALRSGIESVRTLEQMVATLGSTPSGEIAEHALPADWDGIIPARPSAEADPLARPQPLTPVIAHPSIALAAPGQAVTSVASQLPRTLASEAMPTIQVTIGRVEVRATPAPPPPVRKPNIAPVLSLDDYLRARNGGSR